MKKLHIATSPLTGKIFVGTVLKDGCTWGANKQDVTIEAIVAVARHGLKFGEPIVISKEDGTPEFEIMVKDLTQK
tara:strand:+ start:23990 stop:24214 length:225 start_codon:yes stop_codon:yes gene_type:complete